MPEVVVVYLDVVLLALGAAAQDDHEISAVKLVLVHGHQQQPLYLHEQLVAAVQRVVLHNVGSAVKEDAGVGQLHVLGMQPAGLEGLEFESIEKMALAVAVAHVLLSNTCLRK